MTLQWDKLLPTKTTLIKQCDPTVADANYDYGVIWVNKLTNNAWLLKDGGITRLPPTTGTVTDLSTGLSLSDLQSTIEDLEDDIMRKAVYDKDMDGVVDEAESIDGGSF